MNLTLRPYQHQIVDYIVDNPRCKLFVPMGLGKTVSTLTALDRLSLVEGVFPALVVAPLRVAQSTWPDEIAKFPHLRHLKVSVVVGTPAQRRAALRKKADIYCINYDNLTWLDDTLTDWPFATVVADESSRLKGFRLRQGTKRAKALAKYAHKSARYIGLTGTPSPNGLQDLWGQLWFVDKGERLGRTFDAFRQRWFQVAFDGYGMIPLPFAQEQIEDKLRDRCMSLNARDWFDLKDPIVNTIFVDMPAEARRLYRDMERDMFAQIGDHDVEAFGAAARTIKCLQLANGAAYVDDKGTWSEVHDAKIQALDSIVEEAAGAPVMVAYHFKSDLERLQKAFPFGRALDADPKTLRDWNKGKIRLLFAHPASAGHGLNLQDGGNILVFFGHWWDLEQFQQIIERIGPTRQAQAGHDRPVFIHHIVALDTVDEIVMARRETKREVQDLLLEAMKRRGA